jgi:glycosyltransferase involved in cell wall biosynthesis
MEIKALIPAYNEEGRIAAVIAVAGKYADKVIVLNDCSSDNTGEVARKAGAEVITNTKNLGYLKNLLKGIEAVDADILVTIDADGEHPPQRIPDLLKPILQGEADLVLGKRKKIPRFSERLIARLTQLKTRIQDPGTGFRAFKKTFTPGISKIKGYCTCGVFVLFFYRNSARIKEVPIEEIKIDKPRGTAWRHFPQFFLVLWQILTK